MLEVARRNIIDPVNFFAELKLWFIYRVAIGSTPSVRLVRSHRQFATYWTWHLWRTPA